MVYNEQYDSMYLQVTYMNHVKAEKRSHRRTRDLTELDLDQIKTACCPSA